MAYEYEELVISTLYDLNSEMYPDKEIEIIKRELKEVYAKAKAFDEIVIETTGAIMNCPTGVLETEAGKLTLDIIDKYEKQMEDK